MPVYFIAENENRNYDNLRIKIGISENIEKRVGHFTLLKSTSGFFVFASRSSVAAALLKM
jgi:hypothetical protein